jgi:hypothetical protein
MFGQALPMNGKYQIPKEQKNDQGILQSKETIRFLAARCERDNGAYADSDSLGGKRSARH